MAFSNTHGSLNMKKIVLWIFLFSFVLTGCSNSVNEEIRRINWINKKVSENNLLKLYESEENEVIYSSLSTILYKENNRIIDIKDALEKKQITINDLINKMDLYLTANDGGSLYYASNINFIGKKFYLAKCNSSIKNGGIKGIFIDTNEENILHYCVIENEKG